MITNSSGEACTPSAPRSMPGASVMRRASSPEKPLVISVSLPDRMTITVRGSPLPCIAARNPSAIDSTAQNTMTTPPIPMMATTEEPSRCGIDCRVTVVTAMVCDSQFIESL